MGCNPMRASPYPMPPSVRPAKGHCVRPNRPRQQRSGAPAREEMGGTRGWEKKRLRQPRGSAQARDECVVAGPNELRRRMGPIPSPRPNFTSGWRASSADRLTPLHFRVAAFPAKAKRGHQRRQSASVAIGRPWPGRTVVAQAPVDRRGAGAERGCGQPGRRPGRLRP
jgi:hypothetical protein